MSTSDKPPVQLSKAEPLCCQEPTIGFEWKLTVTELGLTMCLQGLACQRCGTPFAFGNEAGQLSVRQDHRDMLEIVIHRQRIQ